MPLWIGAYLADTMHLTRDEHGGYLLLIMAYWRSGSPLPDDDKKLSAIVSASQKEWRELRDVLSEFFHVGDGVWSHKRIDQELKSAGNFKAKQQANGAKGGRPKKTQTKPNNNPDETQTKPNIEPRANPNETSTPSPTHKPTSQPVSADVRDPEKWPMKIGWKPSGHVADLAKQSGISVTPAKLSEFVAHWLTNPETARTQAEWDKSLLQSARHDTLRAASPLPPRGKTAPENFANRNYGTEIVNL
jgi:uncharacterized protein YdaU (DUF1376 family)